MKFNFIVIKKYITQTMKWRNANSVHMHIEYIYNMYKNSQHFYAVCVCGVHVSVHMDIFSIGEPEWSFYLAAIHLSFSAAKFKLREVSKKSDGINNALQFTRHV